LRVRPARDDKTLSSWNALAIKGLAVAGRVLNRPDLVAAASAALDFIRRACGATAGCLRPSRTDGRIFPLISTITPSSPMHCSS